MFNLCLGFPVILGVLWGFTKQYFFFFWVIKLFSGVHQIYLLSVTSISWFQTAVIACLPPLNHTAAAALNTSDVPLPAKPAVEKISPRIGWRIVCCEIILDFRREDNLLTVMSSQQIKLNVLSPLFFKLLYCGEKHYGIIYIYLNVHI